MTRRPIDPENTRAARKFFRRHGMICPMRDAYDSGQNAAMYPRSMPPRLRVNPYPPGRRRDEWERGYNCADPLGDWHGDNR